jgi:PKD repeat protein/type 1 glutamine amidotransferase
MRFVGRYGWLALPALALLAPGQAVAKSSDAGAAAKPRAHLRFISATPRALRAGEAINLSGRVRNTAERGLRPRLVVRLTKTRSATGGAKLLSRQLRRVGPGRLARYRMQAQLPASLQPGTYYVRGSLRVGGRTSRRVAARRLTVTRTVTLASGDARAVSSAPAAARTPAAAPAPRYRVLAFTETAGEYHQSIPEAVDALEDVGRRNGFSVTQADDSEGVFTESNLKRYRTVVFLNTSGDVLDDDEQAAFERYFTEGGGFLGVHSAIETEASWAFMTNLLGTRATGAASPLGRATIKVADRVHDASRSLPEYWKHVDEYYNFTANVRGQSHVLATVDERTYAGGTMGADHPVAWCKDYRGGRSFYTAAGHTPSAYEDDDFRRHLAGAISWAAGRSDPVYSDCGATVLGNYQQTKISAPPNLDEPIGFDVLPDGRVIQTERLGRVKLHTPGGETVTIADLRDRMYTHSEDGLYGPAIDNDFARNKWVYLYYSPSKVTVEKCDGSTVEMTTPSGAAPNTAADPCEWQDNWSGYFQLSRFKFVDGPTPTLDLSTEQKIMKVDVNRGACCHVAGDIDFDRHNNLWLVTGDDTPAGGGNSGGFGPFNDQKTNESQTVRVNGATGGTFTLTFAGQTTAAIPFDATAARTLAALEGLANVEPGDVVVTGNAVNAGNQTVTFRGQYSEKDVTQIQADPAGLTGTTPAVAVATTQQGDWFNSPHVDARRSSLNTNDLRGKVLRIKVGADGSYTSPTGNLFPESQDTAGKTRPEIYGMGFRNPFRIQVDENDVAYVTDYSPDSRVPQALRGPAGTGRVEIVRKPANYAWPVCYGPKLPYYRWNFNTSTPLDDPARPFECDNSSRGPENTSRWNTGLTYSPPVSQPDVWYSYNDNAVPPLGTPCLASYNSLTPAASCPQLFPELGTGGVGPHGAAKYNYDPGNANPTKLPPYYDEAVFFGEFTRDMLREIRLDSKNRVFKINSLFDCGGAPAITTPFECDNPMDMQFGPDGTFYLLTYGDGFFAANPDAGMYKWEYVKGRRAPQAVLGATPTNGIAPLRVQFSSEGSRDLDPGESIEFAWDFDNNGTTDSIEPNPSHVYTANGVYTAKLTVTDSSGKTDVKTTTITVGNTAPTVTITTPADGDFFEWGQRVPFEVTVTDPEDGAIDCSRVAVTFVLVHDQHGHGEATATGCSGLLPTEAEFASHGGYIAGGISATYTDLGANGQPALTTTAQHVVQVKRQQVEYAQDQRGTLVSAVPAAEPDPTGGQQRTSLDPGDWIALNNRYNLGNMDKSITFRFAGGSGATAGQPRTQVEIRSGAPDGPIVTTVTLAATSGNTAYSSQAFPLPLVGSERLYLVFRAVPGGTVTANFGNLNWVDFSGPGVGVNP